MPPTVIAHLHQLLGVLDRLRAAKHQSKFRGRAGDTTVLVTMERFDVAGRRPAQGASLQ